MRALRWLGVVLLVVLLLCAIFAGQIAPYDPNQVQVVNLSTT